MAELLRRAKAGDAEAFVQLMEQQKSSLYKVAKSYLGSDADVADAMQETVLACFEKLGQLREEKYFKTWLTRILINKCKDQLQQRRHWDESGEVPETAWLDPGPANVEFMAVLDGVDEKYRTVLLLYYGEGFSVREIAGLLEMNEETVKTRLKRGRAGFKLAYEAE